MKEQNYKNHRKFYAPHHFVLLPALLILLIYSITKIFSEETNELIWVLFSAVIFLIMYVAVMLRQHYALGNQNRIIRLEFQQRYFELFNKRSDDVIEKLNFGQVAALRFAYDQEFKALLERALIEKLPGDDIKKAITKWRPDRNRV